jgi:3-oxoacyl-[acyl-carrier-protein] synthase-3
MAHSIGILGTGAAVPETVLTNEQLAAMVDIDPEWIQARTGIRERRIADDRTATSELGADGRGSPLIQQAAGGSRLPASYATVKARQHFITMDGPDVYKFAVRILGASAEAALAKAELTTDDIDLLIPHQANMRIIEAAINRLNVPSKQVYVNLDRYGNTSSASIPIALDEVVRRGMLRERDLLVLVAFGAGLTWGATVLRW